MFAISSTLRRILETVSSCNRNIWSELSQIFCFFPKSFPPLSPLRLPGATTHDRVHPSVCLFPKANTKGIHPIFANATSVDLERCSPERCGTATGTRSDPRSSRKSRSTRCPIYLSPLILKDGNDASKKIQKKPRIYLSEPLDRALYVRYLITIYAPQLNDIHENIYPGCSAWCRNRQQT